MRPFVIARLKKTHFYNGRNYAIGELIRIPSALARAMAQDGIIELITIQADQADSGTAAKPYSIS